MVETRHRPSDDEIIQAVNHGWTTAGGVIYWIAQRQPAWREPSTYETSERAAARVINVSAVKARLSHLAEAGKIAMKSERHGAISYRKYASLGVVSKERVEESEKALRVRTLNAKKQAEQAILAKYADEVEELAQELFEKLV